MSVTVVKAEHASLESIEALDRKLHSKFRDKIKVEPALSRQIVSFQANKGQASYRWYKYKEAFSADLVKYLLSTFRRPKGPILDPFAGIGTTLFASSEEGISSMGIELLPIGQEVVKARLSIQKTFSDDDLAKLRRFVEKKPWKKSPARVSFSEIRITKGAYPPETLGSIQKYLSCISDENDRVKRVLRFALLCVLEIISYTRKDGQYLRWDDRSGRRVGSKPFNKGKIWGFDEAITAKLLEILEDAGVQPSTSIMFNERACLKGKIGLLDGSCLDILPTLENAAFSSIITSPPYCNRYDYTRTYALELALLGLGEDEVIRLRQNMLSCTVENRSKDLLSLNQSWRKAIQTADRQDLLQEILRYLEHKREAGELNNSGIPRMVRGYFYEMACVIHECSRVLKPSGVFIMVNDNVRYAGASIPVDLILSDFAQKLGLVTEAILILPNGKGNSSQQMGAHGRDELRKCVYVWRKL